MEIAQVIAARFLNTLAMMLLLGAGICAAQGQPPATGGAVVAIVGGDPVRAGEVDRLVGKVAHGQEIHPAARPILQAQTLAEIIDRRLVLAYARRTGSAATPAQLAAALAELKAKLASQRQSLEAFLQAQSITEADLGRQLAWNVTWPRLLARYLSEERMRAYFDAHRRDLDGTEVSVSHILLRPAANAGPRTMDDLVRQAQALRGEIMAGRISFEEAARRRSSGPSAAAGGKLGFIARRGAMVESFSRAAFALKVGQLSPPVVTPFGVHLIRVDAVKPGSKQPGEVRKELEEALARELLEKLARLEEQHTALEFTGKGPYFKPGTREVVAP